MPLSVNTLPKTAIDINKYMENLAKPNERERWYLPVQARIAYFREHCEGWSIETTFLILDTDKGFAVCTATIRDENGTIRAVAHKSEDKQGFFDYIEKAETGAIGRALGILGVGTLLANELWEADKNGDVCDTPQNGTGKPKPAAQKAAAPKPAANTPVAAPANPPVQPPSGSPHPNIQPTIDFVKNLLGEWKESLADAWLDYAKMKYNLTNLQALDACPASVIAAFHNNLTAATKAIRNSEAHMPWEMYPGDYPTEMKAAVVSEPVVVEPTKGELCDLVIRKMAYLQSTNDLMHKGFEGGAVKNFGTTDPTKLDAATLTKWLNTFASKEKSGDVRLMPDNWVLPSGEINTTPDEADDPFAGN